MNVIPYIKPNQVGTAYLATTGLKEFEMFDTSSPIPAIYGKDLYLTEKPENGWNEAVAQYLPTLQNWSDWKTYVKYCFSLDHIRNDNNEKINKFSATNFYLGYIVYKEETGYRINFRNVFIPYEDNSLPKEEIDTHLTHAETNYYMIGPKFTPEYFYFKEANEGEIEDYCKANRIPEYRYFSNYKLLESKEKPANPLWYGMQHSSLTTITFPSGVQNNETVIYSNSPFISGYNSRIAEAGENSNGCAPCMPIMSYTTIGNFFVIHPPENWVGTYYINVNTLEQYNPLEPENTWAWCLDGSVCGRSAYLRIIKGPVCTFNPSDWETMPILDSTLNMRVFTRRNSKPISSYLRPDDEIVFDVELADKTFNYKRDDYTFVNGVAKDIHYKFIPTTPLIGEGEAFLPKSIFVPLYWANPKQNFRITLTKYPKVLLQNILTGYLRWGSIVTADFEAKLPTGKLTFTLSLTGMGNDPCKRGCSCDIDSEDKKYKTVIEFSSDVSLKNTATISPETIEYAWEGNNLSMMLAEGEEVTVENLPIGTDYLISIDSEDPCDENEYNIDNGYGGNSGTIGEDSEGYLQQDTNVSIEAQSGETLDQYLERLRQRGYEKLAESLKLENVEFTLQDERIKLGDLVTVDMPEFDFKAVVRVTGVKLKSQDNQTIRTISVGTPLKILRKPRI